MNVSEEKLLPPAEEHKLLESAGAKRNREKKHTGPSMFLVILALVLITGALFLFGWLRHHRQQEQTDAAAEKERDTAPVVNVTKVRRSPSDQALLLPGNITPLTEAFIYARASGYVTKRHADIGDRVRAGQLLAEIDAPDLDQQVAQARAAVAVAEGQALQARAQLENQRANLSLATVTAQRYRNLLAKGAVARQDADQQETNFHAAEATVRAAEANVAASDENVRAARANVNRLVELQGYEKIRAPFTGVITARNFDIGALVANSGGTQGASASNGGTQGPGAAGSSGSAAPAGGSPSSGELFRIAQFDTVRILINVPQEDAPSIHNGEAAEVFVQQFQNRRFLGHVSRNANAVDLASRTMLTEVQVPNPQLTLMPGMYAQVRLTNVAFAPPLLVPGDSIISLNEGLRVAVLVDRTDSPDANQKSTKRVHLAPVQVGRDYGQEVEVRSGLQGWEYVVVNPGDMVEEGAVVQPVAAALKQAAPGRRRQTAPGKGPSPKQ